MAVGAIRATGRYAKVYNLRVADYHTYFVGDANWSFAVWAHNSNDCISRLVPGGGLAAHEAAGGHTIARHVGKTDAQLAARLAAEPHISKASTFIDRATAESAIAQTIEANQAAITTWLGGSSNVLRITHSVPGAGRVLVRGAAAAIDVDNVRVVLVRDPSLPTGYRILTAFPQP